MYLNTVSNAFCNAIFSNEILQLHPKMSQKLKDASVSQREQGAEPGLNSSFSVLFCRLMLLVQEKNVIMGQAQWDNKIRTVFLISFVMH